MIAYTHHARPFAQVVALVGKPESTVRDACKKAGSTELEIRKEEGTAVMGMLKGMGSSSRFNSKVSIIKMYDTVKLIRRLGNMDMATEMDHLRLTTQPPPLRHAAPIRQTAATAALPQPAPPASVTYTFPSSIPEVYLTPNQQTERYALVDPTAAVLLELGTYIQWCHAPVNTERSSRYIKAAQTTTLEKVPSLVMAFMGATSAHFQVHSAEISLDMYKQPKYITRFIG